ncbi:hypothetical protein [Moheibacter sediminis]|uniref:Cytochrome B n=1 Tax=Moheibacter sediminis TaxID=1434700 RepID=A0A1W2CUE1_9FLAO|nr:hypothetical protein [Moheibacter sediminis]SMC88840.1 hypothetical protein SAMN06296427_111107 [Moheibacter sediminis]
MDFYSILKHIHSGWAYLVILAALFLFLCLSYFILSKKEATTNLRKVSFITTMIFHIQLLAGAILYLLSPYSKWTEDTMKDDINRLYAIEHPLMMFAAVALITIVNSRIKKYSDVKFTNMILVALAIACMLAMIPWHAWPI